MALQNIKDILVVASAGSPPYAVYDRLLPDP